MMMSKTTHIFNSTTNITSKKINQAFLRSCKSATNPIKFWSNYPPHFVQLILET